MNKKLLKLLFFIAVLCFSIPGLTAKADTNVDFVVKNGFLVEYKGSSANVIIPGDLGITKIADTVFANKGFISTVTIPKGVTSIGERVFLGCSNLTSVTIPDSVTSIGSGAFIDCTSLTSVTIPDGVTSIADWTFKGCSSLENIIIPNSVTSIGTYAFYQCSGLKNVIIGNSVSTIGKGAFELCSSLTDLNIPDSVNIIGEGAFGSCSSLISVTVPDSVTVLQGYVFERSTNLASVKIGKGVTYIGEKAFYLCKSLKTIEVDSENEALSSVNGVLYNKSQGTLICYPAGKEESAFIVPDSVSSISSYAFAANDSIRNVTITDGVIGISKGAFQSCGNLESINIPHGVTSIEENTFENCFKLANINIPSSVTTIGRFAFYNCESLKSIVIPDSVYSIRESAFSNCKSALSLYISNSLTSIETDTFSKCTSLKSIVIPNGVKEIGNNAFWNCTGLTSITIPSSVISIGFSAFETCSSLESINIPNSVTYIGRNAFNKCTSLKSVTIPTFLSSISDGVFNGCSSLTSVTIPKRVLEIGSYAFYSCSNLTDAKFLGDAPRMGGNVFYGCAAKFKVLYPVDKTGYTNPWYGYASESRRLGSYRVTYDGNGSTGGTVPVDNTVYVEGDDVLVLNNPGSLTKSGYTFAGWNTQADGKGMTYPANGLGAFFGMGPANVTLYANWTINTYNKYQYKLSYDKAVITGYTGTGGNLEIPAVIDGYEVTEIADYAFFSCSSLTGVSIPNSVKSIGNSAFEYCTNLSSVTIPSSVTAIGDAAFYKCASLKSIIIPESVKSIGNFAFSYCSSLTDATLSNNITAIGNYMFYFCRNLKNVNIPGKVKKIGNNAFVFCSSLTSISIPTGVTNIGNGAFAGCAGLTGISIPESVTTIGNGAFDTCTGLTSIIIPDSVTTLGYKALNACTSLLSVKLSNRLTSIGDYAFSDCYKLWKVNIPESVTSIGSRAFEDCTSLTGMVIPNGVTRIGERAFGGCSSLRSVTIPESVIYMGNSVFAYCSSLTSVIIPSKVTKIGDFMFNYSFNLASVTIPSGVTSIGESAFLNCKSLTSITIPSSVKSISRYAFEYCSSLTEAKFLGNAPEIGEYVFDDCAENFKVYYLEGSTGFTNPWNSYPTATFTPQKYMVIYEGNGSTGGLVPVDSNTYLQGETVAVMDNTGLLEKTGYIFDGWNTKADGSGIAYNATPSENAFVIGPSNVTLYAMWTTNPEKDYIYVLIDNKAVITGYTGKGGDIAIPASIDGYAVAGIGERAFYSYSIITSVNIPEGVTSIGNFAFASCRNLVSVNIPDSVKSIGSNAFNSCSKLENLTLPEGITNISDALFYYCLSLSSVSIPNSVTEIGMFAFGNCISLANVTIPENVSYISFNAFRNSSSLTEAKFLGNAPEMGDYVFDGSAEEFKVYYLEGKTGFTNPWYGYPTQLLYANSYTVTFESNGGSAVPNQSVAKNAYAAKPADPFRAGYTFGGWYLDNNTFRNSFGFVNTAITANITLYAKWIPVKALTGIEVTALPKKRVYLVGESLDLAGLVVKGYYNDGTTAVINVTESNITGFDSSNAAESQIITVTVDGMTTTFTVKIIAKVDISVSANPRGGAYNKSQSVVLIASEPSAIYYTTDGTEPSEKSKKYTYAIKLSTSTTLKFIAVDKDGQKSEIYTENYIIDTAAPKVKAITPVKSSKNAPLDQKVTVEFTEEIQMGLGAVTLADSRKGTVPLDITISEENKKLLVITPKISLKPSEKYTLTVAKDGVRDLVGNSLSSTYTSYFYTIIMPVVKSTSPVDQAVEVRMSSSITVKFNIKVYQGDGFKDIKLEYAEDNERKQADITATLSGTTLTIKPKTGLKINTQYYVTIPKDAVRDTSAGTGKTMIEDYLFQFTTEVEKEIKAINTALAKLPADDIAAAKIKSRKTLEGYLAAVNKAIAAAREKGIADEKILRLANYGRIAIAQKRIDTLKAEEEAIAKAKAISAVAAALKKLPVDDAAALKLTSMVTLQKYVDAVNKAIASAKEKGATDSEIEALPDYGRIAVALKRIDELK